MTKENPSPEPTGAVMTTAEKNRSAREASGHVGQRPVSKESEAIIKEVSVRRRTAMKVLANR